MEKTIKLSWADIAKWLIFIGLIVSSFVANQVDISNLKRENKERKDENKSMMAQLQAQEQKVAQIDEKLNAIGADIKCIKNAILKNQFKK